MNMKSKNFYILTIFFIIVCTVFFCVWDSGEDIIRTLQHEQPLPVTPKPADDSATQLPIINIDTQGQELFWLSSQGLKYNMANEPVGEGMYSATDPDIDVSCMVTIWQNDADWNIRSQTPNVQQRAKIHIRGNSSKWFDKKSFLVKFMDDKGEKENVSVMGMPAYNEWVLYGPCLDRTLIRNYICYNVSGQILPDTPDVRFCDLYFNGEYKGVYLAIESIDVGEERLNLSKTGNNVGTTSWLIRLDREKKADVKLDDFSYYTYQLGISAFDVLYPGSESLTQEKLNYVTSDLSKIEYVLHSLDATDTLNGYQKYINRDAFVKYFIINEFFANVDAGRYSTYYYKDLRGKVTPVVWDFNNSCDNQIFELVGESGFTLTDAPWFEELLKDKAFVKQIIYEYRMLRNSVLSNENLQTMIDDTVLWLGDNIEHNYQVYSYLFDVSQINEYNYLIPAERNYSDYASSVAQLKNWIYERGEWLDHHIDSLLQYCQDSKNIENIID